MRGRIGWRKERKGKESEGISKTICKTNFSS